MQFVVTKDFSRKVIIRRWLYIGSMLQNEIIIHAVKVIPISKKEFIQQNNSFYRKQIIKRYHDLFIALIIKTLRFLVETTPIIFQSQIVSIVYDIEKISTSLDLLIIILYIAIFLMALLRK
jgi:hypothetical protein